MAIKGVDPKCYILALFVREDGERFLLGSGRYVFKEKQQHFQANKMANDVIEVQGNDGYLLAGQVRRPGTQDFDGYVGDGTSSKAQVEQWRRDFFKFFRKNYLYKVIYVFSDGSAIQRKRGFLVDAPTVEELYQIYPEYHVALNFEDINYYFYNEDSDGHEIYGKSAIIGLTVGATGGLMWDSLGAISLPYSWLNPVSVSGTEIQINNQLSAEVPITDLQLDGDTFQQTYSGKNLFDVDGDFSYGGNYTNRTTKNGDGTITVSANFAVSRNAGQKLNLLANTEYVLSCTMTATTSTQGHKGIIEIMKGIRGVNLSNVTTEYVDAVGNVSFTFTTPADVSEIWVAFSSNGTGATSTFANIQIEQGSTPTSYEPYTGGIPAPNPDYPQDINVVTGEQTVTVTNSGGASTTKTVDLGSIELAKIGTYQDYIYKSGDDWYVHKECNNITIPSTNWTLGLSGQTIYYTTTIVDYAISDNTPFCSAFKGMVNVVGVYGANANPDNSCAFIDVSGSTTPRFYIKSSKFATAGELATWIANNSPTICYALATPTDTKITDATLIGELEGLEGMKLFIGENNVLVTASSTNLPAILSFKYYTGINYDGAGFEWEAGGSGGDGMITVDSIDDVYPMLTIPGPVVNPTITNVTTGSVFQYTGTLSSTQTLEVDLMAKTAFLNGVSVIANVTSSSLYFKSGMNRVSYTTNNADAPDATIKWQEIVG